MVPAAGNAACPRGTRTQAPDRYGWARPAISGYAASPPPHPAGAARMPPAMIMRGEHDFVSESSVAGWRDAFNTGVLRYMTLSGCSHHGLSEDGASYGEIVDSFFSEYD